MDAEVMAAFILARVAEKLNRGDRRGLSLMRSDLYDGVILGFSEINQVYKLGCFSRITDNDVFFPEVARAVRVWSLADAYVEIANLEKQEFDIVDIPSGQPWLEGILEAELGEAETAVLRQKIDHWLSLASRNQRKRIATASYRNSAGRSLSAQQRRAYDNFVERSQSFNPKGV